MDLILYNLVNSPWFWIFVAVWVILGVVRRQWEALVGRLRLLVSRPPISKDTPDEDRKNDGFYPGWLFVYLARVLNSFANLVKGQHDIVWTSAHKMRTPTYLLLLICALAFGFADYIAIANGLSVFVDVDILLTPFVIASYGLAVGIATFLSAIVGFLIIFQANAQDPDLIDLGDDMKSNNKRIAKMTSLFIILIALFVGVFIGIKKLIVLGFVADSPMIENFAQFGVHVLILINGTLSAGLIFNQAWHGVVLVGFIIAWVCIVVFEVGRHLLDYVVRLVIALLDILLYFIFTPIFEIVAFGKWIVNAITGR